MHNFIILVNLQAICQIKINMENYIRDLLKEKDRVIIPNMGGFLKSKGEINNLIFNEFIKFNDGQLINFVARRENIGIDEASRKVDEFVESAKSRLNKGKKISIDEVGTLFMGERGRLRFSAEPDAAEDQITGEPADEKTVETADRKKEKQSPEKDEKTPVREPSEEEKEAAEKEVIEETQSPDDTGESLADKPPVPVPDENDEKTASVDEVSGKEEPKTPAAVQEKKAVPQKEKIPQKDPRNIPPATNGPGKERKRRSPFLWIIPLIIVLALGLWLVLDYDNVRGYFHMSSEEVADTEPAEMVNTKEPAGEKDKTAEGSDLQGVAQEETAPKDETEAAVATEEPDRDLQDQSQEPAEEMQGHGDIPPESISPAKKYHLIAGVFSDWENARELVDRLKEEGFYADIIALVNGRYYVSYNSFKKKSDARYEWQRLLDKGYEAWLYYY